MEEKCPSARELRENVPRQASPRILLADIPKFVVGLWREDARIVAMTNRFLDFGNAFNQACRVQGVPGWQCDVGAPCIDSIGAGACGCAMSHMKIWRHMVDHSIPVAIVMEDDGFGQTAPGFTEFLQSALDRRNEFDVFRLTQIDSKWGWMVPDHVILGNRHDFSLASDCRYPWSTGAYIMTLSGAKFAVASHQYGVSPVDNFRDGSAYLGLNDVRIGCYDPPILGLHALEKTSHREITQSQSHVLSQANLTSQQRQDIDRLLPDCPSVGFLMDECPVVDDLRTGQPNTRKVPPPQRQIQPQRPPKKHKAPVGHWFFKDKAVDGLPVAPKRPPKKQNIHNHWFLKDKVVDSQPVEEKFP